MARKRIKQQVLADALHMSRPALAERLNGNRPFNTDDLVTICAVLDLDMLDLFPQAPPSEVAS